MNEHTMTAEEMAEARKLLDGWRGRFVFVAEHAGAEPDRVVHVSDGGDEFKISDNLDAQGAKALAELLNLPARLLEEVERMKGERDRLANGIDEVVVRIETISTQFGHPGVLPVDRLRAIEIGIADIRAEVERLTREAAETQAYLDLARAGTISYRDAYLAYQDWAASRSGRLRSLASSDAAYRATIDAALEIDEPAEEPTEIVTAGIAYMGAYMKCECCGADIERGEQMAIWRDNKGMPVAFAHAGPCPEPDLWAVEWRLGDAVGRHDVLPLEEAAVLARRKAKEWAWSGYRHFLIRLRIRREATP